MEIVHIRIPTPTKKALDKLAKTKGMKRAALARDILIHYFDEEKEEGSG